MKEQLENRYVKLGAALFAAGAGIILFYFLIRNFGDVKGAIGSFIDILMPFIYGAVIAYLLSPIFNVLTRRSYHFMIRKTKMPRKKAFRFAKVIGTIGSMMVFAAVVAAFAGLLVPQIVTSVIDLVGILPARLDALREWIGGLTSNMHNSQIADIISGSMGNANQYIMDFLREHIMPGVDTYLGAISQGIMVTLRMLLNLLIGVIAAVYFLNSKEKFKAETRKIIRSFFRRDQAQELYEFWNFTDKTFSKFIAGKIIDSIIIGIICYIAMMILHLPYPALCSTIIGVTNIIPFFGPFIGAVPTSIIIFIQDPIQSGIFIILIFALQQFDGNILGPKILGEAIGIASFWVMFSIVLFGGLFGFLGMVVGVPVFAVFYYYFKKFVEKRLARKGLPVETWDYQDFNKYDVNRKDIK